VCLFFSGSHFQKQGLSQVYETGMLAPGMITKKEEAALKAKYELVLQFHQLECDKLCNLPVERYTPRLGRDIDNSISVLNIIKHLAWLFDKDNWPTILKLDDTLRSLRDKVDASTGVKTSPNTCNACMRTGIADLPGFL